VINNEAAALADLEISDNWNIDFSLNFYNIDLSLDQIMITHFALPKDISYIFKNQGALCRNSMLDWKKFEIYKFSKKAIERNETFQEDMRWILGNFFLCDHVFINKCGNQRKVQWHKMKLLIYREMDSAPKYIDFVIFAEKIMLRALMTGMARPFPNHISRISLLIDSEFFNR
jgi:hypothetical protein